MSAAYTPPPRTTPPRTPDACRLLVGLHVGRGLFSTGIRWQTGGDYSHVSLVVPWAMLRPFAPDRQPNGAPWWFADTDLVLCESREPLGIVCDRTLDQARAAAIRVDVCAVACTWEQLFEVLAWWGQRIGLRPYDFMGCLRFVTRQRAAEDDQRWFCSEAVFVSLREAGLPLLHAPACRVSPAVLAYSTLLQPVDGPAGAIA